MADVWKKLNLKDQSTIFVLRAPASFEPAIKELSGVEVRRKLSSAAAVSFLLAFLAERAEIARIAKSLASQAEGDAVIWIAYPKKSSKRYTCDFNRDSGWEPLGEAGFEAVRQVAIDEDWSALRSPLPRRVHQENDPRQETGNDTSGQNQNGKTGQGQEGEALTEAT